DGNPPADAAAGRGGAGRGGRGAGAGGGRGGGRGDAGAPATPPPTPESSLAAAIEKAMTGGHLWRSEGAGYSPRWSGRRPQADGGEHLLFLTDRRLGTYNDLWKPSAGTPTNYDFSVIEIRLNAKGEGEGRASLTGKVAVDPATKTIGLENYAGLPVLFKDVK